MCSGNNKNRYLFFLLLFFIFAPIFCLAETRCYCYESSSDPDGGAGRYFSINCPDENCDEGDCRYYQCAPDTVPITEIRDYQAQTQSDKLKKQIEITTPVLQVDIGDTSIQFDPVKCSAGTDCEIPWLAQYIKVIFQYLVGLAAIASAAVILFGGFVWLTSFGSPEKVKQAKDYIVGAFVGLFLALFSYLILFIVNPNLVNFKPFSILSVSPLSAPAWTFSGSTGGSSSVGSGGVGSGNGIVGDYDFSRYATSGTHAQRLRDLVAGMGPITNAQQAQVFIDRYPGSPITGEMIMSTAERYNIDPAVLLAELAQDSSMGTAGRGADSNNPGNYANADNEADTRSGCRSPGYICTSENGTVNCCFSTWQEGVDAVGGWLDRHRTN